MAARVTWSGVDCAPEGKQRVGHIPIEGPVQPSGGGLRQAQRTRLGLIRWRRPAR